MNSILIVDDSENILLALDIMFKEENYNTIFASDGREALKKLEKNGPDIILMDMEMPVLNGMDTLIELRKKGHTVPVIMMTAGDFVMLREKALASGAQECIQKPFNCFELIRIIKRLTPG